MCDFCKPRETKIIDLSAVMKRTSFVLYTHPTITQITRWFCCNLFHYKCKKKYDLQVHLKLVSLLVYRHVKNVAECTFNTEDDQRSTDIPEMIFSCTNIRYKYKPFLRSVYRKACCALHCSSECNTRVSHSRTQETTQHRCIFSRKRGHNKQDH